MDSRKISLNYIYALEYIHSYNTGTAYLHVLDTHYMVACNIEYEKYDELVRSKKVHIKNINKDGVICRISKGNLVVLFKNTDGTYLVADYLCNLSVMTLEEIKRNKDKFVDVKFVGKGLTTKSGKIPNINKRAYNIFKMNNFNTKASILGISTLTYDFDYNNNIVIMGVCNETDRLEIPNFAVKIAEGAFKELDIKHVVIGNNVVKIGANAFKNCRNITDIKLGSSIKEIGSKAFFMCKSIENIEFNESLELIDEFAFYGTSLKHIVIRGKLNKIKYAAFSCTNLQVIDIKNTLITHLTESIYEGKSLSIVRLPRNLKSLNIKLLSNLYNLKDIYIPESLQEILVTNSDNSNNREYFLNKIELKLKEYFLNKIESRQVNAISAQDILNCINS